VKIGELIARLQKFSPEREVRISEELPSQIFPELVSNLPFERMEITEAYGYVFLYLLPATKEEQERMAGLGLAVAPDGSKVTLKNLTVLNELKKKFQDN